MCSICRNIRCKYNWDANQWKLETGIVKPLVITDEQLKKLFEWQIYLKKLIDDTFSVR